MMRFDIILVNNICMYLSTLLTARCRRVKVDLLACVIRFYTIIPALNAMNSDSSHAALEFAG